MRFLLMLLMLFVLDSGCSSGSFSGSSSSAKPAATAPAPAVNASGTMASPGAAAPRAAPAAAPIPTPVMTPPTNAIIKGSFTLWAVPNHPQPGQDYVLYCQVTLPAGTSNYSGTDLAGVISGTDGYRQQIGASGSAKHQQFQSNGSSALLSVGVPGAFSNVVDSITVSSALLGETQTATLEFGY